ncbi:MAG: VIT1/CCC1 transporter family protein, partial [Burkholderiales bacterium]
IGQRHRTGGGNLRAAVFGINDGLVSNASLIMGMAGAAADSRTLLLAGVAGLLAGAFSMAAGEYVSVRSQREVFEYQIALERAELEEYPEAEAEELAIIYQAKGLARDEARRIAGTLIADPERALDTLAREELGLNPDELGSPWGAAIASFVAFGAGALIPLLPFLVLDARLAFGWTVTLTALALFSVGAVLSLYTGRGAVVSGIRMLAIGAAAGLATYGIGALVGVAVA